MKYKIKEVKEDNLDNVIEKTGHVIEFSINDVIKTQEYNRKNLKEVEAMLEVNTIKKENIEKHHPEVLKIEDEKLFTYGMYYELSKSVKDLLNKKEELEKAIAGIDKEMEEVYKQLPELKNKNEKSK